MVVKAGSTQDYMSRGAKVLCYGATGIGKTCLCATAPDPIIISTESGLLSLAELEIPTREITTIADLNEVYSSLALSMEGNKYKTICLDSISDMAEDVLIQYKKEEKDPRNAYGRLNDDIGGITRKFRDIPNKNVYFTAKQLTIGEGIDTRNIPSMPGKTLLAGLPYFFDIVLAMRIYTAADGSKHRCLQTYNDFLYEGKDRSGKLKPLCEPNLTKIFTTIASAPQL